MPALKPSDDQYAAAEHIEVHGAILDHGYTKYVRFVVRCGECGHTYDGAGAPDSGSWKARFTYLRKHLADKHDVSFGAALDAEDVAEYQAHRFHEAAKQVVDLDRDIQLARHLKDQLHDGEPFDKVRRRCNARSFASVRGWDDRHRRVGYEERVTEDLRAASKALDDDHGDGYDLAGAILHLDRVRKHLQDHADEHPLVRDDDTRD